MLVRGCSQECFFLLVSLLIETKEGTFPLLAEEVLLRIMVVHCSKFMV